MIAVQRQSPPHGSATACDNLRSASSGIYRFLFRRQAAAESWWIRQPPQELRSTGPFGGGGRRHRRSGLPAAGKLTVGSRDLLHVRLVYRPLPVAGRRAADMQRLVVRAWVCIVKLRLLESIWEISPAHRREWR